jgi:hypothetical protein
MAYRPRIGIQDCNSKVVIKEQSGGVTTFSIGNYLEVEINPLATPFVTATPRPTWTSMPTATAVTPTITQTFTKTLGCR